MKTIRFITFLAVCLFLIGPVSAQVVKNQKVDRLFEKAEQAYRRGDNVQAMRLIQDVLAEDPRYVDAYLLKGDMFYDVKKADEAIAAYSKAVAIDSASYPPVYYIMANLQFELERYPEAKKNYIAYLAFRPKVQGEIQKAEANILLCETRSELMKNPVPFNPVNLGRQINSEGYEYINSVSVDEQELLFTRKGINPGDNERFFRAKKRDGQWNQAIEMAPPVNSPGNQGALCLSPDGMKLFITCCSRRDSYGSCDLYVSFRRGENWSEPENLGPDVNSTSWDSQPCLSADGRTLYFVSSRRGGFGGSDIWKSKLMADGSWSPPVNLGGTINTSANEMAPFIHEDGHTLYFSSAGHPGMGGADLFVSRLNEDGSWSKPRNLGYPVNTRNDEINLVINAGGDAAYISSAKEGGSGNTDIYRFELPKEVRPSPVSYVKGKVFDKNDDHPLAAAFELIDMQSGKVVVSSTSDATNGEFILSLPVDKDYALNVSCSGYLFYSRNFSIHDGRLPGDPMKLDVPMQPLVVGEKVVLNNIFFDTDKYDLEPDSKAELDKLVEFLRKNPGMKIEISGHTDNVGSDTHNQELSQNRAHSVYNYLISNGIDKERLTFRGYGKSMAIDTNDNPEGRAHNRRTEFKVLAK